MEGLEQQLQSLLSDPGAMQELQSVARALMGGGDTGGGGAGGLPGALLQAAGPNDKRALLQALRPYLSPGRVARLERALRLAKMARLAGLTLGETGNGQTL